MLRPFIACLLVSVAACGGSGTGSGSAPEILSLGTSTTRITESGSVTISVVVTDPDGIGDLIGGSLKTADDVTTFGAFSSGAEEGAYQLVLPWDMFAQALDLSFDGERKLDVVAEFFDAGGERAREPLTLTLYCPAPFSRAIAGECIGFDVCRCNGGVGCDPAPTCDAYCASRQMDCTALCTLPTSTMQGAVVVFSSMANCQTVTEPALPFPEGSTCAAPLANRRGYQCCCSPR